MTRLFRRSRILDRADRLYDRVVEQSRLPAFYRDCGVPDTLDGRFDMICLHVVLVLRRLRGEGSGGGALGQALVDVMIDDMDQSLREMGVGDLGVSRRVKAMAKAFFGRAAAYEAGFAGDDDVLGEALRRNLFGTVEARSEEVAALVAYGRGVVAALDAQPVADLMAGEARFASPPRAGKRAT